MTTWKNADGITNQEFQLGLGGPTIFSGAVEPVDADGEDGDLYVQTSGVYSVYSRVNGIWRPLVSGSDTTVVETVFRGKELDVAADTDFVLVRRNPWTMDSMDRTMDSMEETMDDDPGSWTDIILPDGPEGKTVTVRDDTSNASMYNIYVEYFGPPGVNLIPNSANIGGAGWSGWWKLPAYTSGEVDPFGGNTAVSYPLSECTGSAENNAAGFIANTTPTEGAFVPSVWLKGDAPMEVVLRVRGGNAWQIFTITTEWQRYWFASPASSSSFPGRIIQIELRYSGDVNGILPPETRLFVACPQTSFGTELLDYVPTYGDNDTSREIDGNVHVAIVVDGEDMEFQFAGNEWRVIG